MGYVASWSVFCDVKGPKCWRWTGDYSSTKRDAAASAKIRSGYKLVQKNGRLKWVCPQCQKESE